MKLTALLLVLSILYSCSRTRKQEAPGENFDQANLKKYDTLRQPTRDSLSHGLRNINDFSAVFTPHEATQLDSIIKDYEKETGNSMALITFDSTMLTRDSTEEVIRIIAIKNKINTTVGLFAPYKIYIWNDSLINNTLLKQYETKAIIDKYFLPDYIKGAYFKGTYKGLGELASQVRKNKKTGVWEKK